MATLPRQISGLPVQIDKKNHNKKGLHRDGRIKINLIRRCNVVEDDDDRTIVTSNHSRNKPQLQDEKRDQAKNNLMTLVLFKLREPTILHERKEKKVLSAGSREYAKTTFTNPTPSTSKTRRNASFQKASKDDHNLEQFSSQPKQDKRRKVSRRKSCRNNINYSSRSNTNYSEEKHRRGEDRERHHRVVTVHRVSMGDSLTEVAKGLSFEGKRDERGEYSGTSKLTRRCSNEEERLSRRREVVNSKRGAIPRCVSTHSSCTASTADSSVFVETIE